MFIKKYFTISRSNLSRGLNKTFGGKPGNSLDCGTLIKVMVT